MPEAQLLGDKTYKMCYEIFCIVFIGLINAFFKYFIIHLVISVFLHYVRFFLLSGTRRY